MYFTATLKCIILRHSGAYS